MELLEKAWDEVSPEVWQKLISKTYDYGKAILEDLLRNERLQNINQGRTEPEHQDLFDEGYSSDEDEEMEQ